MKTVSGGDGDKAGSCEGDEQGSAGLYTKGGARRSLRTSGSMKRPSLFPMEATEVVAEAMSARRDEMDAQHQSEEDRPLLRFSHTKLIG